MNLSPGDAGSALRDVEAAERRSLELFEYGVASPYLLLWGALWIGAGAVELVVPAAMPWAWLALDVVGLLGTAWLAVGHARRYGGGRAWLLRLAASAAALAVFVAITLMVFAPVSGSGILAFVALLVAAGYAVAGCWAGPRYAVVGAVLAAAVAGTLHLAPAQLPIIVPFVGGGALVLGGLWLRRG